MLAGACGLRGPAPAPPPEPWTEALFARKPFAAYTIRTPRRDAPGDTVIGAIRSVTVREGDTLFDIARLHDVGADEMVAANPGVDPWIPPVGTSVVVPMAFVLPCCTYEGLVLNVPELRLFFYRPGPTPGTTIVETFPVGLGRSDYRTPVGRFRIAGKTVNPVWGVPDRIRAEHIRERGDARRFIAGGAPDNPLGRYRFELDRTLYRIHGTNKPWGIGRQVSHGCAQLYPEDIEHLFPLVPVGTPVELTYQHVKAGRRDGRVWIELHPDIYRRGGPSLAVAQRALQRRGLSADPAGLRLALHTADGVPRPVPATPPAGRRADASRGARIHDEREVAHAFADAVVHRAATGRGRARLAGDAPWGTRMRSSAGCTPPPLERSVPSAAMIPAAPCASASSSDGA